MDDWSTLLLYDRLKQNGIFNISTLKILFSPHNEHRFFFPNIIMLISYSLSGFNLKINIFLTQLMAILVYMVCIKYFNNSPYAKT